MLTFRNIAAIGLSVLSALSQAQSGKSTALDSAYLEEVVTYSIQECKAASYYDWEVSGGEIENGQGTTSISVHWEEITLGRIRVTALNESGCPGNTSEIWVQVKKDQLQPINTDHYVFLPDVFTPNEDGVNDIFVPVVSEGIQSYQLQVFNRWGGTFYSSVQSDSGWDGTDGANPVPEGIYVYHMIAKFSDTEVIEKKGTITLYR